ncbi:pentatricopeptide repeat-containing protein [Trifolium repens]|nr:pentatricopeptide repeat-containing protein [Trifolium repens]
MSRNSHYSSSSHRSVSQSCRIECVCGLVSPLMTAWTNENPGRRFHGCGMYKLQGKKECNYFEWVDDEMNPRAKEVILSLLQKINDEKKKTYESEKREDELKKKMKLMEGFNIGPWVMICILFLLLVAIVIMK